MPEPGLYSSYRKPLTEMLNSNGTRVVIIDDDEDDYFIIADYINSIDGSSFTIDWCNQYDAAINKMKAREYDIYFVDYRLGRHTGLELLQEIHREQFDQPVVLLTGKGSKDIDVKAMEYGATDYLIKSELNTEKLERCIRYSLERAAGLKELRAREKRYRTLFEGSKDAVFIADENLVLTEVNHASSLLFGTDMDKLVGRSFYDFIKDETQKNRFAELFKQRGNINDLELEIGDGNPETRSCLLSISFVEDTNDKLLVHGILHDITNIKKAESANLQAQKLAANERLMRILAHEIRNPLNNISLSADHLEESYEDAEMRQNLVAIVKRNCIRINHIITELLDLTKPQELTFQEHTLQEIMDESIVMIMDRIDLQKIRVEKVYPDHPLEISANKSKLIIALTNIMVNAIEAMEMGKGQLTIAMAATPDAYNVSIRDNGGGIPEEYLTKLFEPFFTLKKNGMGMGLAACYSIIQSHKASIRVESQIGKGTNFIIGFNKK
jgi:PAS domain S-box-containing protein